MSYAKHFNPLKTPQNEPIPGKSMVANSAGGFSFQVDSWTNLDRFLILGSEGGSYYASEKKMTLDAAKSVGECIDRDGLRVVRRVVEVSDAGRAPKNDPSIFVLAMCAKLGNDETRAAARDALPKVCRTGTHLFMFAENIEAFGGWGRGTRNAVGRWYNDKAPDALAYQAVKYQQRNGWSHRDLLRLAHPKTKDAAHNALYKWMTKGEMTEGLPRIVSAFEHAKVATSVNDVVSLIKEFNLPRETVPTNMLNDVKVWEALLPDMPITAMVRNLATMTRVGLIAPLSKGTKSVIEKMGNVEAVRKSRIHPIQVLAALLTYKSGHGARGQSSWTPVQAVVDALDQMFYDSFGNVEATGKSILLALDVSGSMGGGTIAGIPGLTPLVASAAMAMVIARVEKNHHIVGFSSGASGEWKVGAGKSKHWGYASGITELAISPRMRLDKVIETMQAVPMGGTDCALPMLYAGSKGIEADAFIVLTDNETWHGDIHPCQALKDYRKSKNIPAKLVVVGMVANAFSIADPTDGGMMDVVGFDTAAPAIIADFIS